MYLKIIHKQQSEPHHNSKTYFPKPFEISTLLSVIVMAINMIDRLNGPLKIINKISKS